MQSGGRSGGAAARRKEGRKSGERNGSVKVWFIGGTEKGKRKKKNARLSAPILREEEEEAEIVSEDRPQCFFPSVTTPPETVTVFFAPFRVCVGHTVEPHQPDQEKVQAGCMNPLCSVALVTGDARVVKCIRYFLFLEVLHICIIIRRARVNAFA